MRSITRNVGHGFRLALVFAVLSCAPAAKRIETSIETVSALPHAVSSPRQFNHGFEKNQGQNDKSVRFLLRGSGQTLFFTDDEAVMTLSVPLKSAKGAGRQRRIDDIVELPPSKVRDEIRMAVLRMKFDGADPARRVTGEQPLRGKVHYNIGGAGLAVQSAVPTYGRMRYRAVWPRIDVVFSLEEGRPRYDFVVAPGADPAKIRLSFTGAQKITVARNGDLVIDTPAGEVRHTAPKIYQPAPGGARRITGRYKVFGMQVGFKLDDYDRTKPLIIHPVIFAGLHGGGSNLAMPAKLATGADGALYVLGSTVSPDLPGPHQTEYIASYDAYVAKFDLSDPIAAGAGVPLYVTYLGGSGWEQAQGITVDATSQVYVTGRTLSADFLQAQAAAISPTFTHSGDYDGFVVRLRSDGIPDAFTFLGGSESDYGHGIAVDATGIYVAGITESADFKTAPAGRMPVTPFYPYTPGVPADETNDQDAFIVKLEPDLSAVRYFSFLGGSKSDFAYDVAVRDGAAYVTGGTLSPNFRTRNAVQNCLNSAEGPGGTCLTSDHISDVFVARFKPEGQAQVGNALDFSTYLGGDNEDRGYGIAVDTSGAAYIAGYSYGSTVNFPTTANALQPSHSHLGQTDAVLAKLGANGSLLYSTFLGGTGSQEGSEITVDTAGNVFITGDGGVRAINNFIPPQPPTPCGYTGGWSDVFVAKFLPDAADPATLTIDWWCLIGGSSGDYSFDVAVDSAGGIYVSSNTQSTDFFITPDPTPPTGLGQTFLVKIVEEAPIALSVTKTDIGDPIDVGDSVVYVVTVTNNSGQDATGIDIADFLPLGFILDTSVPLPPGCNSQTTATGIEIQCDIGTLSAGQSAQRVFAVIPTMAGTFTNRAEVTSDDGGVTAVDEVTTVNPGPVTIAVEKVALTPSVVLDDQFTYQIRVINEGPGEATNVRLIDQIANQKIVRMVAAAPESGTCNLFTSDLLNCDLGTLAENHTILVEVTAHAAGVGSTVNTAFAWADQSAGTVGLDSTTTTVTPSVFADLSVEILSPTPSTQPGIASFLVRAINNSPDTTTVMPAVHLSIVLNGSSLEILMANMQTDGHCAVIDFVSPPRIECNSPGIAGGSAAQAFVVVRSSTVPQMVTINAEVSSSLGGDPGPLPNTDALTFELN